MATKKITFNYKDKPYVLEFDAASIKKTEEVFEVNVLKLDYQTLSITEKLFKGAFIKNHPETTIGEIEEIYKALSPESDGNGLGEILVEMAINAMSDIATPSGNVKWVTG